MVIVFVTAPPPPNAWVPTIPPKTEAEVVLLEVMRERGGLISCQIGRHAARRAEEGEVDGNRVRSGPPVLVPNSESFLTPLST